MYLNPQTHSHCNMHYSARWGDSDEVSQQGVRLHISLGYLNLLFILHPRRTHNLIQSVHNRKTRPTKKAYGHHKSQPTTRTYGRPKRRYSYLSSMATPKLHHNWSVMYLNPQTHSHCNMHYSARWGDSDEVSQQGVRLHISLGYLNLLFILHPRRTHNLIQSVHNRKTRPTKKAYGHHKSQPTTRTYGRPKRRSSYLSSMAAPKLHHNWCQSDGHRCKIPPQPLSWQSVGSTGEV